MSASQILLAGHGQDDRWLSMTPDRTYFEAKYTPRVNRSRETYEIPFDNQVTFDSTGRCTIPVKGDYMSRLTLRAVMPPIYPTVPGQYVFPTPSSQVGGTVYVNMGLTQVVADGTTLTANTVGNHYFSIGAQVTLAGTAYVIFDLDGTYTISSIPTANSFTCSTTLAGISYNGTVSSPGIQCGDIISYFSTTNSNLWVNNLTNKTWKITSAVQNGSALTFTTSAPSNFPIGSQNVLLKLGNFPSQIVNVLSSTQTTFTTDFIAKMFVSLGERTMYSNDGTIWYDAALPYYNYIYGVTYGTVYVAVGFDVSGIQIYSNDGATWQTAPTQINGQWISVTYGNNRYVAVGVDGVQGYSDDGLTWHLATTQVTGIWRGVTYGNNRYVAVGEAGIQAYSNDGLNWYSALTQVAGSNWYGVTYGKNRYVSVGGFSAGQIYSNDGLNWYSATTQVTSGIMRSVTYGNNRYVAVGFVGFGILSCAYSDDGLNWTTASNQTQGSPENWTGVSYGNGVYAAVSFGGKQMYSYDGNSWFLVYLPRSGIWYCITFGNYGVTTQSDYVSTANPPFQLADRVFSSSNVYSSISFANAADAAFWGFDSREGLTYSLPATPPWTYTQSGWISGFLPPSTSTYDDSVAHKLCKDVRILVGKQTIKEYSGEYIELQNDLLVPYENKAILKLMNGTLDQTQATVSREYYVNLPLGTKEVPLCALTHQHMSVEIDFDSYLNLSQNLNQGTGDFLDAKSYTTYNASTGILNGQPINVQTTFSYQQYIFIVTYGGQFIVYDTTKDVSDPTSYIVLSAFSGTSLFSQFCVLSGNLYIGLTNGQLARMIITELIQGIISSFELNNYTPTIGSLTGTIVADFRYVYYTVSNTATSNVFLTRYDTIGGFTTTGSYTAVDFTQTFNSGITGVYQILSTGSEIVMLPQGTPGKMYTYQLNANVQSQWDIIDYSPYGYQITSGVVLNDYMYFVLDSFIILTYQISDNSFESTRTIFAAIGRYITNQIYSNDGVHWNGSPNQVSGLWNFVTYGNNQYIAVGDSGIQCYSASGRDWYSATTQVNGDWQGVTYGNNKYIAVGLSGSQAYSNDGLNWYSATTQVTGDWYGVTYGNNKYIAVGLSGSQAYSSDGLNWYSATTQVAGSWMSVTYGNNIYVATGDGVIVSNKPTQAYSYDGNTWYASPTQIFGIYRGVTVNTDVLQVGTGYKNLLAFGSKIYASSNSSTASYVIEIDTTKDLNSITAYRYYSSANASSPIAFESSAPVVFANGPRYVYMFAQGDTTAKNIVEFDPYGPDTTFKASILVDYESLPPDVPKPDKALIGLVQTQKVTDMNYMNIKGPVKELWVTGVSATTNVFQYSNLAQLSTLELTGEKIVTEDEGTHTFLNVIEPFETHTSMPIRNVSVISFEFNPESAIPNGTINFSRIRDQIFEGGAQTIWARNYNLLKIQGGIGGLIFDS